MFYYKTRQLLQNALVQTSLKSFVSENKNIAVE